MSVLSFLQASAPNYPYNYSTPIWEWFWILLLFVLAAIRVFNKKKKEDEKYIEDKQKEEKSSIASIDPVPTNQQSIIKKLKDLQELKEAGVITDEEAEQEKRRILNKPTGNEP